jgi:hypothetical protein
MKHKLFTVVSLFLMIAIFAGLVSCGTSDNPNGDAYFQDVHLQNLIVETHVAVTITDEVGVTQIPGPAGADGVDGSDGISISWLGSLSAAPVSPSLNNAYYDTTYKTSYIWDGDSWEVLCHDGVQGLQGPAGAVGATGPAGNDGIDGDDGADGADGSDGISISWQGSLASAPLSPSLNMAYYNTVDCVSYIWDGDNWEVLCRDGSGTSGSGLSAAVLNSSVLSYAGQAVAVSAFTLSLEANKDYLVTLSLPVELSQGTYFYTYWNRVTGAYPDTYYVCNGYSDGTCTVETPRAINASLARRLAFVSCYFHMGTASGTYVLRFYGPWDTTISAGAMMTVQEVVS